MKNETARREIEALDHYLQNHTNDYSEKSHTAMMMAIEALEMANFPTYKEIAEKAVEEALDGYIYQGKTLRDWVNVVEQWQELKETIIEARDGDGTGTQQEICKFLVNYMDVLEKNVSGSENPNNWIPCSERMPEEENKSYWICTDYGHQCECRWTNVNPFWTDLTTDWHWHHMDVPSHQKVVAWMPLPEPYKTEGEVEE